ncbi:MAG: hypothetical protein KDC24_08425, partial [Saprospiraceae bacterium]|nr:hypothetical protein [Saprospiraceae bacterium]
GLLEVYANVVGLEIFVLDVEGNSLLKAGKIDQAFTELDPTGWPKNAKWLQFVKDGRVRVMKF